MSFGVVFTKPLQKTVVETEKKSYHAYSIYKFSYLVTGRIDKTVLLIRSADLYVGTHAKVHKMD